MDPLSVTAGVVALLTACVKVSVALKEFQEGTAIVDAKVQALLHDVESFTQVLQTIKETLDEDRVQASIQGTGHIGNHFKNLSTSIEDGQKALTQLQGILDKVNKSVSVLDGPRKHLRLKGATEEILVFQLQIRSCRDTLSLSLQAVALWNQVTFQEANDKILPNLDGLHQAIRHMAMDIGSRMDDLQNLVETNSRNDDIRALTNLRKCVQSAATVVSSASTALGIDDTDRATVVHGSDFGDLFPPEPNEAMKRWISSNTVYEFDGDLASETTLQDQKSTNDISDSENSDSDAELEVEIIQEFFNQGQKRFNENDFEGAEHILRTCLTRISQGSLGSSGRCPKVEITGLLITSCQRQKKWREARSLLMDKIALGARGSTRDKSDVLPDMLVLVEVLFQQEAYSEALLYGRKALKGYRRLGSSGIDGTQSALRLLIRICHETGNLDEAAFEGILVKSIAENTTTEIPKKGIDWSSLPLPPSLQPLQASTPVVAKVSTGDPAISIVSPAALAERRSKLPLRDPDISDKEYRVEEYTTYPIREPAASAVKTASPEKQRFPPSPPSPPSGWKPSGAYMEQANGVTAHTRSGSQERDPALPLAQKPVSLAKLSTQSTVFSDGVQIPSVPTGQQGPVERPLRQFDPYYQQAKPAGNPSSARRASRRPPGVDWPSEQSNSLTPMSRVTHKPSEDFPTPKQPTSPPSLGNVTQLETPHTGASSSRRQVSFSVVNPRVAPVRYGDPVEELKPNDPEDRPEEDAIHGRFASYEVEKHEIDKPEALHRYIKESVSAPKTTNYKCSVCKDPLDWTVRKNCVSMSCGHARHNTCLLDPKKYRPGDCLFCLETKTAISQDSIKDAAADPKTSVAGRINTYQCALCRKNMRGTALKDRVPFPCGHLRHKDCIPDLDKFGNHHCSLCLKTIKDSIENKNADLPPQNHADCAMCTRSLKLVGPRERPFSLKCGHICHGRCEEKSKTQVCTICGGSETYMNCSICKKPARAGFGKSGRHQLDCGHFAHQKCSESSIWSTKCKICKESSAKPPAFRSFYEDTPTRPALPPPLRLAPIPSRNIPTPSRAAPMAPLSYTDPMPKSENSRKILLIGESGAGKTALARSTQGAFTPETFEIYRNTRETKETNISYSTMKLLNEQYHLETVVSDELNYFPDRITPAKCTGVHVILICISLHTLDILDIPEWESFIRMCTKVVGRFSIPSLLIGLQSDEEYGSFSDAEGRLVARRIGAERYLKCSVKENTGVQEVFEAAVSVKKTNFSGASMSVVRAFKAGSREGLK